MSIISEALKKAGQPIVTEAKDAKKKRGMNWGPLFALAILFVIAAPLVAPLVRQSYRSEPSVTHQLAVGPDLSRPHMKRQFGIEEAALPSPMMPGMAPHFSLSGLVYAANGSYCIINGNVAKAGDTVDGARLIKITPIGAALEYQGQKIFLSAND